LKVAKKSKKAKRGGAFRKEGDEEGEAGQESEG